MDDDLESVDTLYISFLHKFRAIRIIDTELYVTNWSVRASVFSGADENIDPVQLNLATMKIRFWFENFVDDSIMFAITNEWARKAFLSETGTPTTSSNIFLTHLDPTDDKLALLLQHKMNALAGDNIIFSNIEIESDNARGLAFLYVGETEAHLPTLDEWVVAEGLSAPWWARNDSSTFDAVEMDPLRMGSLDFLKDVLMTNSAVPLHNTELIRPDFKPRVIKGNKSDD